MSLQWEIPLVSFQFILLRHISLKELSFPLTLKSPNAGHLIKASSEYQRLIRDIDILYRLNNVFVRLPSTLNTR